MAAPLKPALSGRGTGVSVWALIRTIACAGALLSMGISSAYAADPPPAELGNQPTNLIATSAFTPQLLAKRSDRSGCDGGSDDTASLAIAADMSTRGSAGTISVKGGQLDTGGIWRALYWDRTPDRPLCAFLAEPVGTHTRLVIHGIRHANQAAGVRAVEQGKFLCRCKALTREPRVGTHKGV